jgi:hypothetical protein
MYLFARTSYGIHMTTRQLLESSGINILIPSIGDAGSIKAQLCRLIMRVRVLARMDAESDSVFHYKGLNPWIRVNKICILLCIVSPVFVCSLIFHVCLFCS